MAVGLHQYEARRVPQFVAEVPVAFDAPEFEAHVTPGRRERGEREAERVAAVGRDAIGKVLAGRFLDRRRHPGLHEAGGSLCDQGFDIDAVDEIQRVKHVTLGLRHLLTVSVTDEAMDVNFPERDIVHEPQAHHDHSGNPEKDDVEAGDQHAARIEPGQAFRALGPSQRGEGPQRGREPGVEHILVLGQRNLRPQPGSRSGICLIQSDMDAAVGVVPCRYPVTPPELP